MRDDDIAIVGLACRMPGAKNLDEYWENLQSGVESITFLSDFDLREAGVDPAMLSAPDYVRAAPVLDQAYGFDAAFFRYSPREARAMDPQHRLFLECAWASLEHAGYCPDACPGRVGVFGGSAMNTYLLHSGGAARFADDYLMTLIGNDKDYLTTRVSYQLNLIGPSVAVQTACSTALVAVHMACQSLLNAECDTALAGGVSVRVPQKAGYRYRDNGPLSQDGHCRAFDAAASGTIFSSGVGIVVLKRLGDARADGDCIHAVIKGSAVNNDGSAKVDFAAPSVERQADVVIEALANAGVDARSIGYLEAHGSGTRLGDPVEIAALTKAFRTATRDCGFCAIGSVKTNVGHLDAAAGIAGLIKTVLALRHASIPPSLHFETPNPEIRFAETPFAVATTLADWPAAEEPRRASVHSLGIGGTNAHVVLEEAPAADPSGPARAVQLLTLSARTPAALNRAAIDLADHLAQHPSEDLADVAWTLQRGRKPFEHRRVIVCRNTREAITQLAAGNAGQTAVCNAAQPRDVVFLFAGQGTQRIDTGRELYRTEQVFRREVDCCARILEPILSLDLRDILYPSTTGREPAREALAQTRFAQPALFAFEYALARLWMAWGVQPAALIGHSLGDYVAACLAGIMTLGDALRLVAARGRLMQSTAPGAMLVLPLGETETRRHLTGTLSLAAANAPGLSVVSGRPDEVARLRDELCSRGVHGRLLATERAFHSALMEPVLDAFAAEVAKAGLRPPALPIVSNVSGGWLSAADARDPAHWARQMRETIRFSAGITTLTETPGRVLLEIGPDTTLTQLAGAHPAARSNCTLLTSLAHPKSGQSDGEAITATIGRLWLQGVGIDWAAYHDGERRHRIPLPTYPFERQTFFAAPSLPLAGVAVAELSEATSRRNDKPPPAVADSRLETATPLSDTGSGAPRSRVEAIIAGIWCESLGLDAVGVHDDFFELGGQSLLITEVMGRVNRRFGIELSLLSLFASPTIADLACSIEAVLAASVGDESRPGASSAPAGSASLTINREGVTR